MIDKHRLESFSFVGLFVLVSILVFFVFKPFFQIITIATAFAVIFHSPYEKLTRRLGQRPNASAVIVVLAVLLFFIVPLFFLGTQIFQQTQSLYSGTQGNEALYLQAINQAIEIPVRHLFPDFSFNISDYILNALSFVSNNLGAVISQAIYIFFGTFFMLLASFFFLRDGRKMISSFKKISPFGSEHTEEFLNKMYETINSVVKGTLFITLIRWAFMTAVFYFFGIPNALLWGSIAGFIGAVPGLGTPFAIIPAIGYLYLSEGGLSAIGFAIFGIAFIILIDNMLTAYFFGESFDVPSVFVLFSIIGGVFFFGPLGFILGPLVLSLFLSVVHTYSTLKKAEQTA